MELNLYVPKYSLKFRPLFMDILLFQNQLLDCPFSTALLGILARNGPFPSARVSVWTQIIFVEFFVCLHSNHLVDYYNNSGN